MRRLRKLLSKDQDNDDLITMTMIMAATVFKSPRALGTSKP